VDIYFSELFNLPIGALWTAVVGEWELDSGGRGSARLPVEKVILHERFNNYVHDIGESLYLWNAEEYSIKLSFTNLILFNLIESYITSTRFLILPKWILRLEKSREFLEFWRRSCYYSPDETRQAGTSVQGRPHHLPSRSRAGSQCRTMRDLRLGPIRSLALALHRSFGGQCPASKYGGVPAGLRYLGTH